MKSNIHKREKERLKAIVRKLYTTIDKPFIFGYFLPFGRMYYNQKLIRYSSKHFGGILVWCFEETNLIDEFLDSWRPQSSITLRCLRKRRV